MSTILLGILGIVLIVVLVIIGITLYLRNHPDKLAGFLSKFPWLEKKAMAKAEEAIASNPDLLKQALDAHPELKDHPQRAQLEAAMDALPASKRMALLQNPESLSSVMDGARVPPKKTAQQRNKQKAARAARKKNQRKKK